MFKASAIPFLLVCFHASFCQMMPIEVKHTIPTPHGKVSYTTTTWVPVHGMYNYGNANPSAKYHFTVVLKNDSVFSSKTRIDISAKTHILTVKDQNRDKKKISPSDTREIFRITQEGRKLSGIPADSCWLFKAASGRINTYSYLAETATTHIIAIQHGKDGPIVPLTKNSLAPMVGDNPKAVALVAKGKLLKAIEIYNRN